MNRLLICIVVGFGSCAISSTTLGAPLPQNSQSRSAYTGQATLIQTRSEIDSLPASSDVATARVASAPASTFQSQPTQPHSTFYRQASVQSDVYEYPAAGAPRNGRLLPARSSSSFNNANARMTNQRSLGSSASTGGLATRIASNTQAPVYNLNPYSNTVARPTVAANNSRSPVAQQQSSTLSRQQPTAVTTNYTPAQQAQAQAYRLARLAQVQQAQVQQTLAQAQQAQARAAQIAQTSQQTAAYQQAAYQRAAYQQAVYQQSALGLGPTPGTRTVTLSPTQAAFQAPTLNPNGGGQVVPPLNVQLPGQQCCQPNYQFQPGVGTPQFNASAYTPLIRLQNMPPGTYLGQGIIGQPTAYVDGQPFRNLIRYVSP